MTIEREREREREREIERECGTGRGRVTGQIEANCLLVAGKAKIYFMLKEYSTKRWVLNLYPVFRIHIIIIFFSLYFCIGLIFQIIATRFQIMAYHFAYDY